MSRVRRSGDWGDGTAAVHAGLPAPEPGAPLLPGPVFAAPYHLAGHPPGGPDGTADAYGRNSNPTLGRYEDALGALEHGDAVVFASGMAAVSAVLLDTLVPGDVLVLPSDGYYLSRVLAREVLGVRGVEVREVPTAGPYPAALLAGARLVLLETPANPGLDVCDLAAVIAAAHAAGALVGVDNTTATPLGQRPLDLGADFSISSDTKAMTGHSDLLMGHVAVRDPDLRERLRTWRTRTGGLPGPFETWLAHRSLGTVDLRLTRQGQNGLALAELLVTRPEVADVRYPGRPGDPAYALASRQMRRFGGVLSFTLPSAEAVDRFVAASELLVSATSFGGLHSTIDRRAQWGGDVVPAGFVRLSAGCEDTADLVADVAAALDALGRSPR
jgi:cystathionine gamma-lyase